MESGWRAGRDDRNREQVRLGCLSQQFAAYPNTLTQPAFSSNLLILPCTSQGLQCGFGLRNELLLTFGRKPSPNWLQ